jgi:GNAT superfamily N-acetyltransferase
MDPTFQFACAADADVLLALTREFNAFFGTPFDAEAVRAAVVRLLDDDSLGRVWLIRSGGETVGYVVLTFGYSLEFHGRDAFVDELYLRAEHRGRGLGRLALEFVERACPDLGIQALHLEVDDDNDPARALYEKVGFVDRQKSLMTKRIVGVK